MAITILEKTKPICSYCVMRDAYCGKEFEKTKPICQPIKRGKLFFERMLCQYNGLRAAKKQSQTKPIDYRSVFCVLTRNSYGKRAARGFLPAQE